MKRSSIKEEIGQKKPFRSIRQEGAVALLRTTDAIRRHFTAVLAPFDLPLQQFNVLRILRGAGQPGLPTMEIGRRMLEQTPGITRLIDRLVERGWASRETDSSDRRQVVCRITPLGLAAIDRTDDAVNAADADALRGLNDKEVRELLRLLDAIRAAHSTDGLVRKTRDRNAREGAGEAPGRT